MTKQAGDLSFYTNANKDYLRRSYDKPIIAGWSRKVGHKLHYLGLPGPEMLDIVEWQDSIDQFTTIERSENEQHLIFLRSHVRNVEHRLHSLYGEFDDILLNGRDVYKHAPRWPYDLVNLDFFGGFVYRGLARPRAIKKLISNQEGNDRSFLLVLTYHLRDGDFSREKLALLDELERRLTRDFGHGQQIAEWAAWYKSDETRDAARQTLYVNSLLHEEGEAAHFAVRCRPAVVYTGTGGAQMIHFVAEFEHTTGGHRAVSAQSAIDVANLGVEKLDEGELKELVAVPRLSLG